MDARIGDAAGGLRRLQAECGGGHRHWLAEVEEPPEEAVAALREALEGDEPLVREHAVWALEQIESDSVRT